MWEYISSWDLKVWLPIVISFFAIYRTWGLERFKSDLAKNNFAHQRQYEFESNHYKSLFKAINEYTYAANVLKDTLTLEQRNSIFIDENLPEEGTDLYFYYEKFSKKRNKALDTLFNFEPFISEEIDLISHKLLNNIECYLTDKTTYSFIYCLRSSLRYAIQDRMRQLDSIAPPKIPLLKRVINMCKRIPRIRDDILRFIKCERKPTRLETLEEKLSKSYMENKKRDID